METMKNVLMILTDQQRKDSLGCYGNGVVQTPNIDRLAKSGIRFNRNYVANPICMPNRLSMFTGQNIRNHGLWTNGLLLEEQPTLADTFKSQGYQTASFGKIHFTPFGGDGGNKESSDFWQTKGNDFEWNGPYWGFEHVELTIGHTETVAHYGKWFYENGGTDEMRRSPRGKGCAVREIPPELHDSTFVADRTVNFLRNWRDKEKPFFAVASFPDPHHPFNPPCQVAEKYERGPNQKPVGSPEDLQSRPAHYLKHFRGGWHRKGTIPEKHPDGIDEQAMHNRIACTNAMVDLIDQNIGIILDALKQKDLLQDTIIVFTSDHGELLGDHGLWMKGPFFYDGLVNTPLIISSPQQCTPRVSDTLFSDIDLAPTLCEMAGVPTPYTINGISQVPHLLDKDVIVREQCLIEYRNGYGQNDVSSKVLVTDKYKYVCYQTGEEELTDLVNDPEEKRNAVYDQEYKSIVNEMRFLLLKEVLATECKSPEQITHA
jgi:arylsulfatase